MKKEFSDLTRFARLYGVALSALFTVAVATPSYSIGSGAGSASQLITPDSLSAIHGNNLLQSLQGSVAGLQVQTTDGAPGASKELLLRGITSVRSSQQPLIILDGVALTSSLSEVANPFALIYPYSNQSGDNTYSTSDLDELYTTLLPDDYMVDIDALSYLDISSIESIEILRDASATAIYGSRGANGVVLITTKTTNPSKINIQLNSSVAVSMVSKKLNLLSGDQYLSYQNALGAPYSGSGTYVDWQDQLYSASISTTDRLELSGSSRATKYGLALNYNRANGVVSGTSSENMGVNSYVSQRINDNLSMHAMLDISRVTINMTQSTVYMGEQGTFSLLSAAPISDVEYSPVAFAEDYEDFTSMWYASPRLAVYSKFGRFKADVTGGVTLITGERGRWYGNGSELGASYNGIAGLSFFDRLTYDVNASLGGAILKGTHSLDLKVGATLYGDTFTNKTLQGTDFFNHYIKAKGVRLASSTTKQYYASYGDDAAGAFAKLDYSFGSMVKLTAGARADYNFAYEDIQYYPFAELELDFTKEKLFAPIFEGALSMLKLNGGWGVSGSDDSLPYYLGSYYTIGLDQDEISYDEQMSYMSRHLSTLEQYNVALEMGFLKNRIIAGVKYYAGSVNDEVSTNYTFDKTMDNPLISSNTVKMDKSGVEFSIEATPIINSKFQWNISAAIGFDRTKITSVEGGDYVCSTGALGFEGRSVGNDTTVTAFIEGQAPGVFLGYQTDGILGYQHESQTPPFESVRLEAGDIKFIDQNNNGFVDTTDRVVIGDPNPDFVADLHTSFRYDRFTLSLNFSGSYGNDVLNLNLLNLANLNSTSNVLTDVCIEAWSPTAQTNVGPAVGAFGYDKISDRLVEDGSYIKLSNLQFSYDFPLTKIKSISSLQVSLMASNLFVLSSYSGYDPSVNSFSGDWSLRGIDSGAYPHSRTISLGVKMRF